MGVTMSVNMTRVEQPRVYNDKDGRMLEMEQHPFYREWVELHHARCMLLAGDKHGWGSRSHTYTIQRGTAEAETLCADTLQRVPDYFQRFYDAAGAEKFFEWVTLRGNEDG